MRQSIFAFSLLCLFGIATAHPALASDRALLEAAKVNDTARVLELLSSGANPNTRGSQGETPLMAAALHGNMRMAEALLAARADTSLADDRQRTALWFAAGSSHTNFVMLLAGQQQTAQVINLADTESQSTPLHMAIMAFVEPNGLRALVRSGASVSATNWLGLTVADACRESAETRRRCQSAGIR